MTETSIDFVFGERRAVITMLLEGFPDNGFALSIFSLLPSFPSYRIHQSKPIQPAIDDAMEKVGHLIERMKSGEQGRSILQR